MAGMSAAFRRRHLALPLIAAATLAACGGGGGADPEPATVSSSPVAPASAPPAPATIALETDRSTRIAAATATAGSGTNDCAAVRPFYWELGDRDAVVAGGSVNRNGGRAVTADTPMRLASATKWLYAAYVAQRRDGELRPADERLLSLRGGYVDFAGCRSGQTVDQCLDWADNGRLSPEAEGRFWYGGGHLQKHASLMGLGGLGAAELAAELRSALGEELSFGMVEARPGGGATGTPALYGRFLRKLLGGQLVLGRMLGSAATCASVDGCPAGEALYAPAPSGRTWHYSLGHWVEDDPVGGDGAFSSAGAFGFYPWVDAARSHYGLVAREVPNAGGEDDAGAGEQSARCGRLIRQAWQSGIAR